MEVGRVLLYLVELGTEVKSGQPLFIAEGDKVAMEIESPVWLVSSVKMCGPEVSAASTGASLVPVTVMVTGWVELTVPSVTVTL